jgi:uncharacterized Ntn-hydrolase superfamily protein
MAVIFIDLGEQAMTRTVLCLCALAFTASILPPERSPTDPVPDIKIATFSIAAVDPETGVCGGAVASKYPAVGKVVVHARPGVGVICTQHYDVRQWTGKALDLLQDGKLPEEVIGELQRADKAPGQRQLGMVDMKGRTAQRHPIDAPAASNYWGGMSGRNYVCQGNTLTGREVIVAMAKAFEETKGSLADRLLAGLIAGDCAGGDHRGRLAAGIRVCRKGTEGYWLDLHVDESDDAVVDLAKKYAELEHQAKGDWPGDKLPFQHPCKDRPMPKAP